MLIFRPETVIGKIEAIYPFDSGAFDLGLYYKFIHHRSSMVDYRLPPELVYAPMTVSAFFTSNEEYYIGGTRKNVSVAATDFEAQGIHELCRQTGDPAESGTGLDERSSSIEIVLKESVNLSENLLAVILPQAFMNEANILEEIEKLQCDVITYSTYSGISKEGVAGIISEVLEFYKKKSYL